jgi:hypothetical protein
MFERAFRLPLYLTANGMVWQQNQGMIWAETTNCSRKNGPTQRKKWASYPKVTMLQKSAYFWFDKKMINLK